MNRHVNAIAGRLSLRPPQRRLLEILDRITEITQPGKEADTAAMLEVIRGEFPLGDWMGYPRIPKFRVSI